MATWDTADPDTYNRLIIIKKMLRGGNRLLEFLFHPSEAQLRVSPSSLLFESGCFSSGEQLLIRVALDIWSCDGDTKLSGKRTINTILS